MSQKILVIGTDPAVGLPASVVVVSRNATGEGGQRLVGASQA